MMYAGSSIRTSTKRAVSLPPDTELTKFPRISTDSDKNEPNSANASYYLDDPYPTDEDDEAFVVTDDETYEDASQPSQPASCIRCQSISLDAMLTRDAQNMHDNIYKDRAGYHLHDDLYDLGDCALRGCRLCQIILVEARRYLQIPETETYHTLVAGLYRDGGLSTLPVFIRLSMTPSNACGTFEVHLSYGRDSTTIASLEIEALSQGQLPFSNVGRPCQYDLGSPLALSFMQNIFHDCLEQHIDCRSEIPDLPSLPTRVIDVGDSKTPPRLITGFPKKGRWIALSHCWGGNVDYTLTRDNYDARNLGMPLSELPATFRDAVIITRNLKIQYLWIDALCILQDSLEDDWPKEASRMGEYYMHSVLTISAMNAENSKRGILQKRSPCFQPLPFSLRSERLAWEGNIAIRESHPKTLSFWERRPVSALTTRGWTFQENCLPPRTLHFTSSGLVWECLCHTAVEWLHEPYLHRSDFKSLIRPQTIDKSINEEPIRRMKPELIYGSWDDLIHLYTARKLTYASDKLPAISGIASMFSTMLGGDRYLAGLWRSKLLEGLCWNPCTCMSIPRSRPDTYRAPSWSWASIDGEVTLDHGADTPDREVHGQYQATILEAQVEHESQNPFGRVRGGSLRLRGLWLPVYLDIFPDWSDAEDGPGTFYFVLEETHCGNDQQQSGMHKDPWKGHVRTQWLDISHPSGYSCLNSRQVTPDDSPILDSSEGLDDYSTQEEDAWQKDAVKWTCVPLARLDIAPTSKEFLDASGQFCMGVFMLSERNFLLLQLNKDFPETFVRIGIADAYWVRGRRFSDNYIKRNIREVVIT